MDSDSKKAPQASDNPGQAKKVKAEHKEIGEMFDSPQDPKDIPDWIQPLSRFRVKVSDEDCELVITDPGTKFSAFMFGGDVEGVDGREMLPTLYARAVIECNVPALRDVFEVKAGERLPSPGRYLEAHRKEWKEWRREVRKIRHANLQAKLRMSAEQRSESQWEEDILPEEPETELMQLVQEEWPVRLTERLFLACYYVITGADYRWGPIYRQSMGKAGVEARDGNTQGN